MKQKAISILGLVMLAVLANAQVEDMNGTLFDTELPFQYSSVPATEPYPEGLAPQSSAKGYSIHFDLSGFRGGSAKSMTKIREVLAISAQRFKVTLRVSSPRYGSVFWRQSNNECIGKTVPRSFRDRGYDSDLVSITTEARVNKGALAYCGTCEQDSNRRNVPTFVGMGLNVGANDRTPTQAAVGTIMHEMIHGMGFMPQHKPRNAGSRSDSMWKSPSVVEFAKKFYNCRSARGINTIENAHWDQEVLYDEMMQPALNKRDAFSGASMSLLKDSGWYVVNFDKQEYMQNFLLAGCNPKRVRLNRNGGQAKQSGSIVYGLGVSSPVQFRCNGRSLTLGGQTCTSKGSQITVNGQSISCPDPRFYCTMSTQSIQCSGECANHGYCMFGKCTCMKGYTGTGCSGGSGSASTGNGVVSGGSDRGRPSSGSDRPGWGRPSSGSGRPSNGSGRPGWGRPPNGSGRPGWGRPNRPNNGSGRPSNGSGRPGWGRPSNGSGRPGWGRPSRPSWGSR